MVNFKIFCQKYKELENSIEIVRIFPQDIKFETELYNVGNAQREMKRNRKN